MAHITPIQAFSLGADAIYLAKRDPPIAPDGKYDWQARNLSHVSTQGHSTVTNLVQQVEVLKKKLGSQRVNPAVVVRQLPPTRGTHSHTFAERLS